MERSLALKAELDGAEKHFSRMGDHITEVSVRTAETLITVLEKMAFYSAGIISLSITFIGYLVSKDAKILATYVIGLPLFIWLFAGWTLLIINLALD